MSHFFFLFEKYYPVVIGAADMDIWTVGIWVLVLGNVQAGMARKEDGRGRGGGPRGRGGSLRFSLKGGGGTGLIKYKKPWKGG